MARPTDSGPGATVSASSVPEGLVDEFDDWVDRGDRFDSRSEAIRGLMRNAVGSTPEYVTPLEPPRNERLARGYKRLCQAANKNGVVRRDSARKACTNGPQNLSKQEVDALVLEPLDRRGYITLQSNLYGDSAWKIVGWDTDGESINR